MSPRRPSRVTVLRLGTVLQAAALALLGAVSSPWPRTRRFGAGYPPPVLRPAYPVRTDRLVIRPLVATDVEAMAAYQSRPDVCRYIPYEPRGAEVIAARVADPAVNRTTLENEGDVLWLGIALADTDAVVGDVILAWRSALHGTVEIGYVIDPAHQGRGYVTEACRALLHLAFDGLGAHRVIARLDARNEASAAVVRRLGMRQEAHLRENEWFKGEWSDELDFAILADEWHAAGTVSQRP